MALAERDSGDRTGSDETEETHGVVKAIHARSVFSIIKSVIYSVRTQHF
jgi:hypothetical protein